MTDDLDRLVGESLAEFLLGSEAEGADLVVAARSLMAALGRRGIWLTTNGPETFLRGLAAIELIDHVTEFHSESIGRRYCSTCHEVRRRALRRRAPVGELAEPQAWEPV
jgi:hypothetical protein